MSEQTIHIIYASTSGNVECVVEKIAETLKLSSTLHRAENTDVKLISEGKYFVLATSTWEHGEINPRFGRLLKEIQSISLEDKYFLLVGLGDRRYEPVLFCKGIDILQEVILAKKGIIMGDVLKIDGSPYSLLDSSVVEWSKRCEEHLLKLLSHEF